MSFYGYTNPKQAYKNKTVSPKETLGHQIFRKMYFDVN